ncbi:MAG: hypothetical protein ACE5G0_22300, partial [Rhodothermales bacterium]
RADPYRIPSIAGDSPFEVSSETWRGAVVGISMSVMMVTDEQIRDFEKHPDRADDLCNRLIPYGDEDACCRLFGWWRSIHDVLTEGRDASDLPFCVLHRGEVTFNPVSDPTWAIYSPTAKALAEALQPLSESQLRELCASQGERYKLEIERAKERGATAYQGVDPDALWVSHFRELMQYVFNFRDFAVEAARRHRGLLFCRYEDW